MTTQTMRAAQDSIAVTLMSHLMNAQKTFQERHIQLLVDQNKELTGEGKGFLFKGQFWSNEKTNPSEPKHIIHKSLYAEAQQMYDDVMQARKDKLSIERHLSMLLRPCRSLQDYRDALPDAFAEFLPQLRELSRTRPEAWHLEGQAFLIERHKRIMELINYYHASRLIL